jgi:hypothetical protein
MLLPVFHAILMAEVMQRTDVRMREPGSRFGFTFQALP